MMHYRAVRSDAFNIDSEAPELNIGQFAVDFAVDFLFNINNIASQEIGL